MSRAIRTFSSVMLLAVVPHSGHAAGVLLAVDRASADGVSVVCAL